MSKKFDLTKINKDKNERLLVKKEENYQPKEDKNIKKAKPGRPILSGEKLNTPFTINLSEREARIVRELAGDTPVGTFIRKSLKRDLKIN